MVENELRDSPASSPPKSATQAAGEGGEGGGTGSDSDSEDLLAAACRTPPPSAPREQADAAPKPSSAECPACKGRHRPHTCGSHGKAAVEARAAVRAAARAAGPTDAGAGRASATGLKRSRPAVVGQRGPILDSRQQKALKKKLEQVRARLAQAYKLSIYVHPHFRAACNLEDDDKVRERFIMSNAMIESVCAGMSQSTKELAGVPLNKVALMDCMWWGESKVYNCCSRSVGGEEHVGELGDAVLTTVKGFVTSH